MSNPKKVHFKVYFRYIYTRTRMHIFLSNLPKSYVELMLKFPCDISYQIRIFIPLHKNFL